MKEILMKLIKKEEVTDKDIENALREVCLCSTNIDCFGCPIADKINSRDCDCCGDGVAMLKFLRTVIEPLPEKKEKLKIVWRVEPAPTGRYRSFEKRSWPTAYYDKNKEYYAASIFCKTEYDPAKVKAGNHAPLFLKIADYSKPSNPETRSGWSIATPARGFNTLSELKKWFEDFIKAHPAIRPKKYQP